MGRIGTTELVLILVVLLLLFGAKRIPDIARSVGKSLNQFKRGLKEADADIDSDSNEDNKKDGNNKMQSGE
ncbi:MAG: twin-arginine translocase TatA/TatE family subunit [Candidatus Sabulitectum sp.]|nr:twin-arginine translocase TatA/TatE family subunit [Candidatus Sabulitectum sp.]